MKHREFTLPDLEQMLAHLTSGEFRRMRRSDYERIFGENDAAVARLRNFAKSHECEAIFADEAITFRKR